MRAAWLAVVLSLCTSTALGAPPDLVKLNNGGLIRGTIVEMDPQGSVVIELSTGELRTIPMSEVDYAGEATLSPKQPGEQQRVRIEARGDKDQLSIYELVGSSNSQLVVGQAYGMAVTEHFKPLCSLPCTFDSRPGLIRLGLALDEGSVVPAESIDIVGDGVLEARYIDRSPVRTAGWVVLLGGIAAGGVLLVSNLSNADEDASTVGLGVGIAVVSAALGSFMVNTGDVAEVDYSSQ